MKPKLHIRLVWFVIALLALGLGIVGIVLPLLPTTPFVLLAAFAFARSSERWHRWLISHKIFGRLIADWQHHGAISRRAKWAGTVSIVAIFALSIALAVTTIVLLVQALVLSIVLLFIWSRPLPPSQ